MKDEVVEAYGAKVLEEYPYWVYVLDCRERWYCEDYQEFKRRAQKRLSHGDDEPYWLRQAWEATECLYVGQTENLEKRLGQHFKHKHSSQFTNVFEPTEIVFLKPCHSRMNAEMEEEQIGRSYYDEPNTFAYHN